MREGWSGKLALRQVALGLVPWLTNKAFLSLPLALIASHDTQNPIGIWAQRRVKLLSEDWVTTESKKSRL